MKGEGGLRRVAALSLALTPSGAFSPGPLSASAVAAGAVAGILGGVVVALGHMIFELPYVYALAKSHARVVGRVKSLKRILSIFASGFMLFFAALTMYSGVASYIEGRITMPGSGSIGGLAAALGAGVALTCCNPYFLLWWVTVGLPLIEAAGAGARSFAVMYGVHVSLDYAWLMMLAGLGGLASSLIPLYSSVMAAVSAILAWTAGRMVSEAFKGETRPAAAPRGRRLPLQRLASLRRLAEPPHGEPGRYY